MRVRPVGYGPWAQISCSVRRAVLPKPGDEPTGRDRRLPRPARCIALAIQAGSLATQGAERDAWRARAQTLLRGLGEALDRQFDTWALTPTEKDTALLLLKGFSHKEIANLKQRSERTGRQHAIAVYRKSGLSGRAELAAFFFEDMLLLAADHDSPPAMRD